MKGDYLSYKLGRTGTNDKVTKRITKKWKEKKNGI